MAIPVLIITGFLGCGKTTFLRHLLPLCGAVGLRPALIINEVGTVDVDGELLADLHAEQIRLVGGCVCCTLQGMLAQTLHDVLERQAGDIIIIECSGLSNPQDVLSVLSAPAFLPQLAVSHIVCLLDASRAHIMLQIVELAKSQVVSSDVLILNKLDKLDANGQQAIDTLADDLAVHATRYWTSYGDIGQQALTKLLTDPAPMRSHCECAHEKCNAEGHTHHHHTPSYPASFCTIALPLPGRLEKQAIERLLQALPTNVIRAKGFANLDEGGWHTLHRVYDSYECLPFTGAAPGIGAILVCIGQHLDDAEITRVVRDCTAG